MDSSHQARAREQAHPSPLREFSEACRREMSGGEAGTPR
jgi:hypothetical protein